MDRGGINFDAPLGQKNPERCGMKVQSGNINEQHAGSHQVEIDDA
jgi:hypothetical protein